jgi:hypothetical protein
MLSVVERARWKCEVFALCFFRFRLFSKLIFWRVSYEVWECAKRTGKVLFQPWEKVDKECGFLALGANEWGSAGMICSGRVSWI